MWNLLQIFINKMILSDIMFVKGRVKSLFMQRKFLDHKERRVNQFINYVPFNFCVADMINVNLWRKIHE